MILAYELSDAWVGLRKRPLFVLSIIATLAVTLGILLCMVNLNQVLLLKALPYPDQDRLVVGVANVYENHETRFSDMMAYPIAEHVEKHADVAAVAAVNYAEEIVTNIDARPKLRVTNATPKYFPMLGTRFAKGGPLEAGNGVGSKDPVAILSYEAWQKYFNGRENILEETVVINDVSYRIVGVTAESFIEPELFQAGLKTQIWLPWEFNTWAEDARKNWVGFTDQIKVLALLNPGQRMMDAEQMLNGLVSERFREESRGSSFLKNGDYRFQVQGLKSYLVQDGKVSALLFLSSSFALALIACINVFNLLLSRAAEQLRQLAIKATLGARKSHIFRQVFAEHLLLVCTSMVLALVLATVVTGAMKEKVAGQLPRIAELTISPATIAVALVLMTALALAFSGIVSHVLDYRRLAGQLKASGKGSGLQVSSAIRNFLVVSQIALAAFLLVAIASVLKVSYATVTRDPGFRVDNLVFANLSVGSMQPSREERIRYIDDITGKLKQLPQVKQVSSALFVPMMSNRWTSALKLDAAGSDSLSVATNLIDDAYLGVMGEEIVRGNNFSRDDVNYSAKKVLVNEELARKIAPSGDAIGKYVYWQSGGEQEFKPHEVIGIVRDVAIPRTAPTPRLYATRFSGLRFIVQLNEGAELSRQEFLNVLSSVHKQFNLYEYERVRDIYDALVLKDVFIVWVAIGLGLLTVLLASIGIYGVLNYGILLRRYELGVRMSIGAGPGRIAGMIYQENGVLFLYGALASLVILVVSDRLLAKYAGYELPLSFSAGAGGYVVIVVSVAAACYLTLRTIITRWPIFALRTD
ncbi:ABC transporter permease [Tahibacter amnicola]|uniref:ABC transporter permease n=1 Tax=Tahibacter amnicola TaxID=2976241 RepID=A0ABY6BAN8_9GAMM|nr:ABC transporter permease [Tahibacter amnicola]UXI66215.1 ABC transporter permease [Tahibacter amnicola]